MGVAAGVFAVLTLLFDCVLLNVWSPYWLVIYVATLAEVAILAYLIKTFVLVRLNMPRYGGFVNLAVAGFLGSVKNTSVGYLATNLGLELDPLWSFRIFGGVGLGIAVFIFCAMVVGARVEHTALMVELEGVQGRLLDLRANSRGRLSEAEAYLASSTRDLLLPKLDGLQNLIARRGEASVAIESLQVLTREHVRPLSESLSHKAAELFDRPEQMKHQRQKFTVFQPRVQLNQILRPNATFFTFSISSWLLAYLIVSAPQCNDVFVASAFSWAILWLAKLVIPKQTRTSGKTALLVLSAIAAIAAAPPFLVGLSLTQADEKGGLFISIFAIAILAIIAFAYAQMLDLDRAEIRDQLLFENEELSHDLAIFDQQVWLGRRAWQFVIHGTVQAALTAALTRLQSSPHPDNKTMKLVDQDLARANHALTNVIQREVNLSQAFEEIRVTWRGICNIEVRLSTSAAQELEANQDARICVNEIVKECVSNGIRHGDAKDILVEIDTTSSSTLIITVTNDGIPVKSKTQIGVGSRLISELATEWSISSDITSGLTVFEAHLPLVRKPASQQHQHSDHI